MKLKIVALLISVTFIDSSTLIAMEPVFDLSHPQNLAESIWKHYLDNDRNSDLTINELKGCLREHNTSLCAIEVADARQSYYILHYIYNFLRSPGDNCAVMDIVLTAAGPEDAACLLTMYLDFEAHCSITRDDFDTSSAEALIKSIIVYQKRGVPPQHIAFVLKAYLFKKRESILDVRGKSGRPNVLSCSIFFKPVDSYDRAACCETILRAAGEEEVDLVNELAGYSIEQGHSARMHTLDLIFNDTRYAPIVRMMLMIMRNHEIPFAIKSSKYPEGHRLEGECAVIEFDLQELTQKIKNYHTGLSDEDVLEIILIFLCKYAHEQNSFDNWLNNTQIEQRTDKGHAVSWCA